MFQKIDFFILLPAVFLVTIGGMVLSSVAASVFPTHFFYYLGALCIFLLFNFFDIGALRQLSPVLYGLALFLLLITIISGNLIRGSTRWLSIGDLTLQPSEVIKPFLILYLSNIMSSQGALKSLLAIAFFVPSFILVFVQPDLGSSLVLLGGFLGIMFISGISLKVVSVACCVFFAQLPVTWHLLENYQKERILTFINPGSDPQGSGYNSIQALIAIGSGQIFGRGLGQGTQSQLAFLPERHTDFIFAALSEELGFWGGFLIITAFTIILLRLVYLIKSSNDLFSTCFLSGSFCIILIHSAVNIGMNLGILPITGIPLPFVSSGGSSLLAMSVLLGVCSQISRSLRKSQDLGIITNNEIRNFHRS